MSIFIWACWVVPLPRPGRYPAQLTGRVVKVGAIVSRRLRCRGGPASGRSLPVARRHSLPYGQVQKHRESRGTFGRCANRGLVQPDEQVSFPVAGDSAVIGFGGLGLVINHAVARLPAEFTDSRRGSARHEGCGCAPPSRR
jgi:hypothetical protein